MLCQNCEKNNATTHIKRVINGDMTEYHLCSDCAAKLGYGSMFSGFSLDLGSFLAPLMGESTGSQKLVEQKRCDLCGSSFEDFAKTGKAGCANCYTAFYDKLLPSLQRIHGNTAHTGKVPQTAGKELKQNNTLEQLKQDQQKAIEAEDFEQAALLRDKIKKLEAKGEV